MREHFQELVEYITVHLDQGASESELRYFLHQHNWDEATLNKAFAAIHGEKQPAVHHHQLPHHHQPSSKPAKYKVFRAIGDSLQAMGHNWLTLIVTSVLSYIIAGLLILILFVPVAVGLGFTKIFNGATPTLASLIVFIIIASIWGALAFGFILSVTSRAIYDGADKHKSSINSVLLFGFKKMLRVTLANFLFYVVVWWPLVLFILLPMLLLYSNRPNVGAAVVVMVIGVLVSIAWIYIALLRFTLVPFIALFEPNIPLKKTFGRSRKMMAKGGQWFLLKGAFLLVLVELILSAFNHGDLKDLENSHNTIINLIQIFLSTLAIGVMVMLYRNRRHIVQP